MKLLFKFTPIRGDAFGCQDATHYVWGIWLLMTCVAMACLGMYGHNIPLAEDWTLVAPFTGHEPRFWEWLWSQNNEHRVPLPRLMLLGLLHLSGGDFRSGMVFNVLILAIIAAVLILVTRNLRGGKTNIYDSFFPMSLLHLGNWENLFWSWQLSFVFPAVLIIVCLIMFVSQPHLATPRSAIIVSICMMLLPLCGANGLLFTPFLILWSSYTGFRYLSESHEQQRWPATLLLIGSAFALIILILYFIDYQNPTWTPPNPGLLASLKTSAKFLALGFGPGIKWAWEAGVFVAFALLAITIYILLKTILRMPTPKQHQAIGIALFLGNLLLIALVMGWGRAAMVPKVGLPMRYVLLSVPTLLAIFFIWELYSSPQHSRFVQRILFITACLLLPFNTQAGVQWKNWYTQGMDAIKEDIAQHMPDSDLASKYNEFLVHWWSSERLTQHIQMLKEANVTAFRHSTAFMTTQ